LERAATGVRTAVTRSRTAEIFFLRFEIIFLLVEIILGMMEPKTETVETLVSDVRIKITTGHKFESDVRAFISARKN